MDGIYSSFVSLISPLFSVSSSSRYSSSPSSLSLQYGVSKSSIYPPSLLPPATKVSAKQPFKQTVAAEQPTSQRHRRCLAPVPLSLTICNALDDVINRFIARCPRRPSVEPEHVLTGNFAPVDELEPTPCILEMGSIPRCLDGAYIRNGPNPQLIPRDAYHHFDGDGMLHCIRLSGGNASYCARFVKTYIYTKEREAGSLFFPSIFKGFDGFAGLARAGVLIARVLAGQLDPFQYGCGKANTSVAMIDGAVLALCEQDLPYKVFIGDDGDVETICRWDFGGKLNTSMTSHPKVDPSTGETFAFRYGPLPPFLTLFRVNSDGAKTDDVPVSSLSHPSFMQDFAITHKYALFMDNQVVPKPFDMLSGRGPLIGYDTRKVARVGVIPRYARDDGSLLTWIPTPGFNFVHTVNAWDEGEDIVLVAVNTIPVEHVLERVDLLHCRVEMVRINLKEERVVSRQPLSSLNLEWGVINPACVGRKNRYAYMAVGNPLPKFSGIVKLDFEKASIGDCVTSSREFGEECFVGEPLFVPKNENGREEDDGYLITYVHNEQTNVSRFVVMDAMSPTLDVVASIRLPRRVPYGFHGFFVREKDLPKQVK